MHEIFTESMMRGVLNIKRGCANDSCLQHENRNIRAIQRVDAVFNVAFSEGVQMNEILDLAEKHGVHCFTAIHKERIEAFAEALREQDKAKIARLTNAIELSKQAIESRLSGYSPYTVGQQLDAALAATKPEVDAWVEQRDAGIRRDERKRVLIELADKAKEASNLVLEMQLRGLAEQTEGEVL